MSIQGKNGVSCSSRVRILLRGTIQGVGFRPFIYRLANVLELTGWVGNTLQGVCVEVEGPRGRLEEFILRIEREKPALASIHSLETSFLDPVGYEGFSIRQSEEEGTISALVLPDIATCPDCLREINDPADRRYRYPFTNCTNCGPRFSIITRLPYDRANTTMSGFAMCPACRAEYENPLDRRFHAQPNACPECGPHLELWAQKTGTGSNFPGHLSNQTNNKHENSCLSPLFEKSFSVVATHYDALLAAAEAIREGKIVAVKGIGGFQLLADARNDEAVKKLRERKNREEKPFALMYPNLLLAQEECEISEQEERLLLSPESPIVLLRRKTGTDSNFPGYCSNDKKGLHENSCLSPLFDPTDIEIADKYITCPWISYSVAPGNPYLGVMLPYTPLHHLLMSELGFPVVATSGNRADEPICTDERIALEALRGIADLFLVHNRPIARHVDDSIARVVMRREMILRRARGYAPLPIALPEPAACVQAMGAHLKNVTALSVGKYVFLSQHIGDLETEEASKAFHLVNADFQQLFAVSPEVVACDAHPDYLSTKAAEQTGLPIVRVQHHLAHVLSCMAENELAPPALGVSWDGTGYGLDGAIWGGEFLHIRDNGVERAACLRPFRLPGGDSAVREPRRTALGLLHALFGEVALSREDLAPVRATKETERRLIANILQNKTQSPLTSSVGRLFDAVAALLDLKQKAQFEGQAAMALEWIVEESEDHYIFRFIESSPIHIDWAPVITEIIDDLANGVSAGLIAGKFHRGLAEAIVQTAKKIGEEKVVLSGGCFQNKYLTEQAVGRLQHAGFRPYWHQRVPPNDGGIALGQIMAANLSPGPSPVKGGEQAFV